MNRGGSKLVTTMFCCWFLMQCSVVSMCSYWLLGGYSDIIGG